MKKLHQLSCEKKHNFFLDLGLPQNMMVVMDLLQKLTCPVCRSKELHLHAKEMEVSE